MVKEQVRIFKIRDVQNSRTTRRNKKKLSFLDVLRSKQKEKQVLYG